jgi:hypothetical protein
LGCSLQYAAIDDRFARRAVWLPVAILAPFVLLLACAYPHGDDFCFGAMWRDGGLIEMMRELYQTFQGRLFSFAATVLPFVAHDRLGADLLVVFRAFCAAALAATIALALWTGQAAFARCSPSVRLLLAFMLAAVLVAGSPQPEDLFYWATGIGFYTIAALFSLWLMVWLNRQGERGALLLPYAVVLLMMGAFLIAMATEISGPVLAVIVLASWLTRGLTPGAPRQPVAHLLMLTAIAAGIAVIVLSPGNAARMRVMGTDQGVGLRMLVALPLTLVDLAQFLVRRLTNPALIGFVIMLILAVPPRERGQSYISDSIPPLKGEGGGNAAPTRPAEATLRPATLPLRGRDLHLVAWLPLIAAMIAIYGSLWIGEVATGRLLEQRALDYLHFILVGGLTLTAPAASAAFGERLRAAARRLHLDGRRLAIAALLLMLASPHVLQAARILPHTLALHRSVEARFTLLGGGDRLSGASGRDVVLPAVPDVSWFGDPAGSGPDAWTNQCMARYVGARSVRIAAPAP